MDITKLQSALLSPEIEVSWVQLLEDFQGGTDEQKQELNDWIFKTRQRFVQYLSDVDDEEELMVSVALSYIEQKSHWQMLNTQINYQVFRKGEAEAFLTYKSALLSTLVDLIGKYLTNEDLDKIHEFLIKPTAM